MHQDSNSELFELFSFGCSKCLEVMRLDHLNIRCAIHGFDALVEVVLDKEICLAFSLYRAFGVCSVTFERLHFFLFIKFGFVIK